MKTTAKSKALKGEKTPSYRELSKQGLIGRKSSPSYFEKHNKQK